MVQLATHRTQLSPAYYAFNFTYVAISQLASHSYLPKFLPIILSLFPYHHLLFLHMYSYIVMCLIMMSQFIAIRTSQLLNQNIWYDKLKRLISEITLGFCLVKNYFNDEQLLNLMRQLFYQIQPFQFLIANSFQHYSLQICNLLFSL